MDWNDHLTHVDYLLLSFWQVVVVMTLMVGAIEWEGRVNQDRIDREILTYVDQHLVLPGSLSAIPIPKGMRPSTMPIRVQHLKGQGLLDFDLLPDRPGYPEEYRVAVTDAGRSLLKRAT